MIATLALAATACGRPSPVGPLEDGSAAPAAAAESTAASAELEARALAARGRLVDKIGRAKPWGHAAWDERVLSAMRRVPRHLFAPALSLEKAYADTAQEIGLGQTISQPSIVAIMTDALDLTGKEKVLEIGTGSGYQAAVLALLARDVYTMEILAPLGEAARERLGRLGYANVHVRVGDGYKGWPEHAPFDRIILTAAPPELPAALVEQLAPGGVLVAPVGDHETVQSLLRYRKGKDGKLEREELGAVRFVPMVTGGTRSDPSGFGGGAPIVTGTPSASPPR